MWHGMSSNGEGEKNLKGSIRVIKVNAMVWSVVESRSLRREVAGPPRGSHEERFTHDISSGVGEGINLKAEHIADKLC